MSKTMKICAILGGLFLFFFVCTCILVGTGISTYNRAQELQNLISAKQKDNTSEYDNMWKKISQVSQVTEKDRSTLMDIFVKHADARTGDGGTPVMNWIKESVPNVSSELFVQLNNTITSSRDKWTMRQKELLDFKREHDNLRTQFPSNVVCGIFGIQEVKVVIVTSSKTEKSFETGKDDDVNMFLK